jgi:AcrR family transcriptional regulator
VERAVFLEAAGVGTRRAIVDAALAAARRAGSWDAVRLQDAARDAGVTMAELFHEFQDRDAVAEAVFDRADEAMLAASHDPAWPQRGVCERLERLVMAWLDALAPDRILVRGMFAYKLQPEHLHLQARGAARISRTVQAMRELALLRATGLRREAEEAALTSIYLATVVSWLVDGSPGSRRTRARLARLLMLAHRVGGWSG